MSESTSSEFEELLTRHLDGALSPEEGARFSQLISADPENARAFARASALHQQVRSIFKFEGSIAAPVEPIDTGFAARWSWLQGSLLIGMVALIGIAVVWWSSGNLASGLFAQRELEVVPDYPAVHILSGTTKLMLPKIGYVLVDGPAQFELVDPMRARLAAGRIKMRVTEETGHGFVVETPFGNVTDLGTEFGLDVPLDGSKAGLVVFDGEVDLEVHPDSDRATAEGGQTSLVKRLVQGEGVTFNQRGQVERINSIVTGKVATFVRMGEERDGSPVIVSVTDNRRKSETSKFYEIVRGGLQEDAKAYVDRVHEWNGVTREGLPQYLIGSDYVKTFGDDRLEKSLEIRVTLAQPAKLYVFFDERLEAPDWLTKKFRKTSDQVGLDGGRAGKGNNPTKNFTLKTGPGESVDDRFAVWERIITEPGTVVLGSPNTGTADRKAAAMYGIAAQACSPNADLPGETSKAALISGSGVSPE